MAPTRTTPNQMSRQPTRPAPARPSGSAGGRKLTFGKQGAALGSYFREVRSELRKVVWPTRRQAINLTAVTLALSMVVGIFLGGVDFIFQEFFRFVLQTLAVGG